MHGVRGSNSQKMASNCHRSTIPGGKCLCLPGKHAECLLKNQCLVQMYFLLKYIVGLIYTTIHGKWLIFMANYRLYIYIYIPYMDPMGYRPIEMFVPFRGFLMAVTFQVLSRTGALPVQSKTLGICARHAAKMVKAERALRGSHGSEP